MAVVGRARVSLFAAVNYTAMALASFLALYPFWYVLVVSFSTREAYYGDFYHLLPRSFSLEPYRFAWSHPVFTRSPYRVEHCRGRK
jgi:ABC-type glycerol-3-phosphate transport system permease component